MIVNFHSSIKKEEGVLIFLCTKSKPLDNYLLKIDKNNKNYIKNAIKIGELEYNSNSCVDLILPQASKAERILLIGLDVADLNSSYKISKVGSFITSVLNSRKITTASLIINKNTHII